MRAEHLVAGDGDAGDAAEHGTRELGEPALRVEHAIHVPAEHVGQRQEADRLRGRRAVDDHEVVVTRRRELLDVGEREHLVEAGHDGELLGLERVGADPVEHVDHVAPDVVPRLLEAQARVQLLTPEARARPATGGRRASTSNASASECAGSVETTIVRKPDAAARAAVAAATVVLPTPPLPVNSRMRMSERG